jgi:Uma2 family endonuclease
MSTNDSHRYTLAEYLELERESEVKYEYWDGEVFSMSGGTLAHDQITGNMFDLLKDQLRTRDCTVFTNNMQIKVPAAPPYRYADGSVVCGPVEVERFNGSDLLVNPILLYEVSPTTEAFDRGQVYLLQINPELSGVPARRPAPSSYYSLHKDGYRQVGV